MTTDKRIGVGPLTLWTSYAILIIFCLLHPAEVKAQWTTPDASQNINNTNTGNVGIGTTTPTAPLEVKKSQSAGTTLIVDNPFTTSSNGAYSGLFLKQAGANRLLISSVNDNHGSITPGTAQFWNFANGPNVFATNNTERMRISPSGYVGIGTTAPGSPLSVVAPSGVREGIQIAGTGNSWIYTDFSMTPIGTIATGKPANFAWSVRKDAFYGGDNSGPSMVMEIARQGGGVYVPFIINPNGNVILAGASNATNGGVGIGTLAPSAKFEVQGTSVWVAKFKKTDNASGGIMIDTNTGYNPNLALGVNGTNKWYMLSNSSSGDVLQFWESTGAFPRLTITQAGAVGIGTPTPNALYKLDVAGSVNSSSGLCINGDCKTAWSQVGGSSQWGNQGSTIYYNSGNVGIGTQSPGALFDLASTTQISNRLLLSGQEFYAPGFSSTSGVAIRLGTNRAGERQIWFADSAQAINATNTQIRMRFFSTSASVDALTTDATNVRPLILQSIGGNVGIGTSSPSYSLDVNGGVNGFRAKATTVSAADAVASFENSSGNQMIVRGNGNVGINTINPTEKLHVTGNVKIVGDIDVSGNIKAKYQDLAEWVESSQDLSAGTVVVVDTTKSNQVIASSESYDSRVAGVISLQPGLSLGQEGEGRVLVATTGRVKVKVDATNGPINLGDLLVTSDRQGFAMKSLPVDVGGVRFHRPGTLIGKALEPLTQGTGEILVLLSLQ